jgi:hypothetical protein
MSDDLLERPSKKRYDDPLPSCIFGELKEKLLEQGVTTRSAFYALTHEQIRAYFPGKYGSWIHETREHLGHPLPRRHGQY